ncbi:molybdopterin molybdotransferase MoeA [Acinetobacter sp. CWB-B33]|uniref:molybdopterin molybdotransferase MoeA n=1 Tax=Acinetobacter sp. CWB-B33 TaxID=2815724 RepID=UPI0031FE970F
MSACGAEPGLISIDQALSLIQQRAQAGCVEIIDLNSALHRYLAENVYSNINLPMFSQSAVDGYAIYADDVIQADATFALIGEIRAGQSAEFEFKHGQAVRIFTGAQIPNGTTTVARQEIVKTLENQTIQISETLKSHADIRDIGEEISVGQCLAEKGQQLTVGAIAALSMAGIQQVQVFQYPKVAVVITGDEVAETVEDFASGKIFDANAPLIQAWFKQRNQTVDIFHVADTEQAVKTLLDDLSQNYQLILTTGGVSVGDYDFIRPVALDLGFEQIFWKVKQKPGKPMFFAELQKTDQTSCYLLGLPGNPAAVYVGMQIYTSTLLDALQGQASSLQWFSAELNHDLKADARERFLRMSVQFDQAKLKVQSLAKQQSHMLSNLMQANCLVRIPAGDKIEAGQIVQGIFI